MTTHKARKPRGLAQLATSLTENPLDACLAKWFYGSGFKDRLLQLQKEKPLTAKVVRAYIDTNWELLGWTPKNRRTYKRAAVRLLKLL